MSALNQSLIEQDFTALQQQSLPLSRCETPASIAANIDWQVLRLDQLPAHINGNKGFKLLPTLQQAAMQQQAQIISFGGAHSNHLHALAHAAKRYGFKCIAVVRAYQTQPLTPTLKDCMALGVQIHFADKAEYAKRHDTGYWQTLQSRYGSSFMISEGGAGDLGIAGAELLATKLRKQCHAVDAVSIGVGTGTCLQGLLNDEKNTSKLLAFLALNNRAEITNKLQDYNRAAMNRLEIFEQFTFGGFAKVKPELAMFMRSFEQHQGFSLEPVYTAKMFYGMQQLIEQGYFPSGSHLLSIHTGGLQGRRALQHKWQLGIDETMPPIINNNNIKEIEVVHGCA